ncbi:MAG: TolC family outer membrane protein [Limnohabitans sp.]
MKACVSPHSLTFLRRLPVAALVSLAFAGTLQAQSLQEVYEMANAHDATYRAARAQYEANLAKAEQGKAALRPQVGLTAEASRNEREVNSNPSINFSGRTLGVRAVQPLYRPANVASFKQSQKGLELASAALTQAEQDLIVRLSQGYFDVLAAQDSLTFVKAQKAAVAEPLASARRNFEVGTATITDTREAQARFDLVTAQEIAAENDLRVKTVALEILVGKSGLKPVGIQAVTPLPTLQGQAMEAWLAQGEMAHPAIVVARTNLEIARLETEKAAAGHKPTIDFSLEKGQSKNPLGPSTSGGVVVDQTINTASAKITLSLPLYAGHSTENRIRETVALEEKARLDLEAAQRQVAQATRTAFLGLQSGLGQVKAYEAAEASSQSALDANKLGYQVGVRINIDVLNSQSQLFQTKRDLAKARYEVLVGQLKLRQAAGVLKAEDLQSINRLLTP